MKWLLSLLLAVLVTGNVDAQIVAKVADGPAMRPLPKYVQALDDEGYAAWAEWQNALARSASEDRERFESPYLSGLRTVTSTQRSLFYGTYYGASSTVILPSRSPNPDYVAKPLRLYNPTFKPRSGPALTPDWDALHCIYNGRVCTISEIAKTLIVPVPMETLYEQLMQPFKFSSVDRVPLE